MYGQTTSSTTTKFQNLHQNSHNIVVDQVIIHSGLKVTVAVVTTVTRPNRKERKTGLIRGGGGGGCVCVCVSRDRSIDRH